MKKIKRIPWGKASWDKDFVEVDPVCHDCGVSLGRLHYSDNHAICDMEQCPYCKEQLLGCGHGRLLFGVREKVSYEANRLLDSFFEGLNKGLQIPQRGGRK